MLVNLLLILATWLAVGFAWGVALGSMRRAGDPQRADRSEEGL